VDQPDELPLVSDELGMTRYQLAAEESHRTAALMEHDTQAHASNVAFHNKVAVEVWELYDWSLSERALESLERLLRLRTPLERILEQRCQWCDDGAIVLDEATVRTAHTERGSGQSSTARTFCSSMATLSTEMTCPRYATKRSLNEHLERLTNK
jgi:hypothetical protein